MSGIDLEDIMIGISVCRNQNLANVFYWLHLIEAYGTGKVSVPKAETVTSFATESKKALSDEEKVLEYARDHGVGFVYDLCQETEDRGLIRKKETVSKSV